MQDPCRLLPEALRPNITSKAACRCGPILEGNILNGNAFTGSASGYPYYYDGGYGTNGDKLDYSLGSTYEDETELRDLCKRCYQYEDADYIRTERKIPEDVEEESVLRAYMMGQLRLPYGMSIKEVIAPPTEYKWCPANVRPQCMKNK